MDQIADPPSTKSLIRGSMFKSFINDRELWVRGIQVGNPFDPLLPVRLSASPA